MRAPLPASLCLPLLSLASPAPAQANPGQSVCTAAVAPANVGEMYILDHQARTATSLTLPAVLTTERTNCVLMTSGATGYVGTNPPTLAPANLYAIAIAGTTVTATVVNTTATQGPNLSQIAQLGPNLYFATQNATNTVGSGFLQSVPAGGGPVTTIADLTALTGWIGGSGGANAVCALGTKVYVASFDATTTATARGCLVEHDTVANTTNVILTLPQGRTPSGALFISTAIMHMQAIGGRIHAFGIYGDHLTIDPATATITSHEYAGAVSGTTLSSALFNSFDYDPSTGDFIMGTRDGRAHRIASSQIAQGFINGVGSNPAPASNSVNGMSHIPATVLATDTSYGAGCAGNGGFTLTDVASGLPTSPNAGFQFGAYSGTGGDPVLMLLSLSAQVPPIDLTGIGMTGCNLHVNAGLLLVTLSGVLSGTGNGAGNIRIGLPIPPGISGTLYRQWAEVQLTPTNPMGVVLSNARRMDVR
jgi:hypothetical protein